jgi:uncharacterized membrane protein
MSESRDDESDADGGEVDRESFDPTVPEESEIGREMVDKSTGLGSVMAHFYRGEVDRMTTWRQRLDQTTYWAVTLMAAILTWAFSSTSRPHYILLVAVVVVSVFLVVEARRYRGYDVWRSRVRMLQQNLFANALDPSQGVERRDWRAVLSEDLHDPSPKISELAAVSHRLRRVYLPLLLVLLVAWLIRVFTFGPNQPWTESASIGRISGEVVASAVGVYYVALLAIALLPGAHHIRGEIYGSDEHAWED